MKQEVKEIEINGITYVPKGSEAQKAAVNTEGLEFCIIRGDRSGIFAGYLEEQKSREVTLKNCRRIWYWDGAASVSQLAIDGVSKPENCKFPAAVKKVKITDVIEIIPTTEKAMKSIQGVSIWKQ